MKTNDKIFGFRSGCKWKKVIASVWYIIACFSLIGALFAVPSFSTSSYDIIIYKISAVISGIIFFVPLLLSDFKSKDKIPLLKKNEMWSNIACILVVIFSLTVGYGIINSMHTNNYKVAYHQQLEQQNESNNLNSSTTNEEEIISDESLDNENNDSSSPTIKTSDEQTIGNSSKMKVHYIDVGQGDAIFIELPNNQTMLIDAGESSYGATVAKYIKNLGYSTINYLVGTHPHTDHIGGIATIINSFNIENIYFPKAISTSKTYQNLLTTISNNNLTIKTAKAGVNILSISNLKINILAPNNSSYSDLNNYSAVIKIIHGNQKFLFMGDAEVKSENEILSDVSANVIKVGHHGSDSSSSLSFINKVNPDYAIISVGKDNIYNHPNSSTINRWQSSGASVYRTDESGTIIVTSDGKNLSISAVATAKVTNSAGTSTSNSSSSTSSTVTGSSVSTGDSPASSSGTSTSTSSSSGSTSSSVNGSSTPTAPAPSSSVNTSSIPLALVSVTSPVSRNQIATVAMKGKTNTEYSIKVVYNSGASAAAGLENKISDSNGNISWSWKIGGRTSAGTYNITVSGGGETKTFQFTVIE